MPNTKAMQNDVVSSEVYKRKKRKFNQTLWSFYDTINRNYIFNP
jgi:hypothetical protein